MYVAFDSPGLTLPRDGDALLVEVFMDAEVDQETLKWLKWCRLYLQVSSVADISTADGKYIRQAAYRKVSGNTFGGRATISLVLQDLAVDTGKLGSRF